MDLHELRIFSVVAREGSFTKAAAVLHTVQSNVTARIKHLETEVGTALLVRRKQGVLLKPAGKTLLEHAAKILRLSDDALKAVKDSPEPHGMLHLGSMEATAAYRLPPILADFNKQFPSVDISLSTGTTAELVQGVLSYELEGAFVAGGRNNPELQEDSLFKEGLVLLSGRQIKNFDALMEFIPTKPLLVFRTGCFFRLTLEQWLAEQGKMPLKVMELGTLDGILGCVAAGMGTTIMPRAVVEGNSLRKRLICHRFPSEKAQLETVFIRRKDGHLTSTLRAFLAVSRQHA